MMDEAAEARSASWEIHAPAPAYCKVCVALAPRCHGGRRIAEAGKIHCGRTCPAAAASRYGLPALACRHAARQASMRMTSATQPPAHKILRRFEEAVGFAAALHATGLTRTLLFRGASAAEHSARLLAPAGDLARARFRDRQQQGSRSRGLSPAPAPIAGAFDLHHARWARHGVVEDAPYRNFGQTMLPSLGPQARAMLALPACARAAAQTWIRYEDLSPTPGG